MLAREVALVIFDLLTKPEIKNDEDRGTTGQKFAKDLLETLKQERLVLDGRNDRQLGQRSLSRLRPCSTNSHGPTSQRFMSRSASRSTSTSSIRIRNKTRVYKITLYPIFAVADMIDGQPFDQQVLPFEVVAGVTVEDVRPLFTEDTFRWVRNDLGRHDLEDLQEIHHAILHRYVVENEPDGSPADVQSEKLVRNVVACLRLIRPMRQRTGLMRGVLLQNGTINVQHFEHPRSVLEVPEVQKLFHLRNADLGALKAIVGEFLRAMAGEFWKFRMAVDFHEAGHFQDWYWKARYSLWCSALEALYTTQAPEHRGSTVAEERIKWFLGAGTSIYDGGDIPGYIRPQPNITVGGVVEELYVIRNCIAHGDKVPNEFFQRMVRQGVNGELSGLQVLIEALSFIIRKSLHRILRDGLLNEFAGAASSQAYFGAAGLTSTGIRRRQNARP
jgi:hypothetical protein